MRPPPSVGRGISALLNCMITTPRLTALLNCMATTPRCSALLNRLRAPVLTRAFLTTAAVRAVSKARPVRPGQKKTLLNSNVSVGYWLIGTSGLVFGIVVLGGLTRLTESGLSITEWKPVTGSVPPLTQADWEEEFEKYKASPEFKQLNSHLTLEEFKFIFYMEWAHRLWGRAIGVVFVLPALWFAARRQMCAPHQVKVFALAALLGLQGFVGWWMVKSGLDEDQLAERRSKPTVSQYRLTTHLGIAFALYCGMLWTGFEILREHRWVQNPVAAERQLALLTSPLLRPLRRFTYGLVALTFLTALSGGLVAGLDAGLIYNNFPHMTDTAPFFPSLNELMSESFSRKADQADLFWRNMLENPTMVQLNHRILATTTFFSVMALAVYARPYRSIMPRNAVMALRCVVGAACLQVTLGISALVYLVPTPLASAHQAGALALLTAVVGLAATVKTPRLAIKVLMAGLHVQAKKVALVLPKV